MVTTNLHLAALKAAHINTPAGCTDCSIKFDEKHLFTLFGFNNSSRAAFFSSLPFKTGKESSTTGILTRALSSVPNTIPLWKECFSLSRFHNEERFQQDRMDPPNGTGVNARCIQQAHAWFDSQIEYPHILHNGGFPCDV